jgi:membrane fusion protein, multidrug efflux system
MESNDIGSNTHNGTAGTSLPTLEQDGLEPAEQQEPGALEHEVRELRSELEYLRIQQQTLQRTPLSNDRDTDNDAQEDADDAHSRDPAGGIFHRRPARLVLALVVTIALGVAGLHIWNFLQSYEWTDDAEIDGHLDPISTRVDGTVVAVYVEDTYHVKAGQPLVDLDARDYEVEVAHAAAELAQAQQATRAAQQNYDLSVANVAAAIATNNKAQLDVARYRQLLKGQVIARETYDEIAKIGKVDAAAVKADRASVAAAARLIGQAKAGVQSAQAALDRARLNLSYTHIVAPASGVVGDKTVQVGQRIQPGQQLMTVVNLDDIWITADFRETQLRRMRRGQPVTVHVDTTGRDYRGYIEGMPGATGELYSLLPPENATGNYVKVVQRLPVRIRLYPGQDPGRRLRPGMSVEPTVWLTANHQIFAASRQPAVAPRSGAE